MSDRIHYKTGLVLGKFMPFHKGHHALIQFALSHCESLIVLLCVHEGEIISGSTRMEWLSDLYANNPRVKLVVFEYNPSELTNQSESSEEESIKWARTLQKSFPGVEVFFTSEAYGEIVAKHWGIQHLAFDRVRQLVSVSGTEIRNAPIKNWEYLPDPVKPYFVKKVVLSGTESTGKSMLAQRLAGYFKTTYVSEAARDIVSVTNECSFAHLEQIAIAHAQQILRVKQQANKILFIDTDIHITKSYSRFLFNQEFIAAEWIMEANRADLYLFLENDAPYIQDGTRLQEADRNLLQSFHKKELDDHRVVYSSIFGSDWDARFEEACRVVQTFMDQY